VKVKNDNQLVEAACQGHTEAINALLIQHRTDARRFAYSLCATHEDAEDALQESLWVVWNKIGTLRVPKAFISWLYSIVKHECYRLLRIRRKELLIENIPDDLPSEPETGGIQSLISQEVVAAIENLPYIYRQVIIMRDMEGMTSLEVSTALGVTIEAVKSRLYRARNILRKELTRCTTK
jgi:RNA polymerase sigma factor (sigma-70 family)